MDRLVEEYQRARVGNGYMLPAEQALNVARARLKAEEMKAAFYAAGGGIIAEYEKRKWQGGNVRIVEYPDQDINLDFLLGDTYNPAVNPDINPNRLKKQEKAEIARINRDGVWGYIAEYFNGEEWIEVESIWGFVGDDFVGSSYDIDLMDIALLCLRGHNKEIARDWEESRLDMYVIPVDRGSSRSLSM